jgi:hypothetical protein
VARTDDFGATWTSLATPALRGYAHVVKQDPINPDLLFLGTEFGLWITVDGGRQWGQYTANFPPVAVRDMAIHPREHDLVLATHGRGVYIVDDITPLRRMTASTLDQDVVFLETRPAPMMTPVFEFGFNGDAEFVGESPSESASIVYYLKRRHMIGDMRLEISDAQGRRVATLDASRRRGLNRVEWPMRSKPPRMAPGTAGPGSVYALLGPRVPAGTYTVTMVKGTLTLSSAVTLVPAPGSRHSDADRRAQEQAVGRLFGMTERLAHLVAAITDARDQARRLAPKIGEKDPLRGRLVKLADELERQRAELASSQRGEGISGEQRLREEIGGLYGNVNGYEGRPTQSQLARMEVLDEKLRTASGAFEATMARETAALSARLARLKLEPVTKLSWEAWDARAR